MRRDVLEVMADELLERAADPMASFTTWDEGRRKVDGMSRGKRWDIDREQHAFEKESNAELRHLYIAKWQKEHVDRVREAKRNHMRRKRADAAFAARELEGQRLNAKGSVFACLGCQAEFCRVPSVAGQPPTFCQQNCRRRYRDKARREQEKGP